MSSLQEPEPSDEEIEALLADYLERRESGDVVSAEDFASAHPQGGAKLRSALRTVEETEALFPDHDIDLPAQVGSYSVLGEIGRGGMGRILRVEHEERPGEELALKLLHVGLEENERALERFRREGEALERLRHPGVVRVIEAGVAGSRRFLAMELVEGASLAQVLNEARARRTEGADPDPETLQIGGEGDGYERASRIVARIARAVAAAHREGVLHRDLNPRNVLLRTSGEPVVIDFGLMRSDDTPTLTKTGDMLGTPQYMAPEQARGERVDKRTDVYGLGAILFELLTLDSPRTGDSAIATLREAGALPVRRVHHVNSSVPKELAVIAYRALAFDRGRRYADAEELAADLEAFLEGTTIAARGPGPLERFRDLWLGHRGAVLAVVAVLAILVGVLAWPHGESIDVRAASREALERGTVAWMDGDLAKAREHAETYAELLPEDLWSEFLTEYFGGSLPETSQHAAVRAVISGEKKRRAGRHAAAVRDFEQAWNLAPGAPFLLLLIGQSARDSGNLDFARRALEQVARPLGASLSMHRQLGEVYRALGAYDHAILALETALRMAPEDVALHVELSRSKYSFGDPVGGLQAATHVLRLTDGDPEPLDPLIQDLEEVGAERALDDLLAAIDAG